MKKRNVGVLIFLLVVGFAAVATTLVINGTFNLSFDNNEFTSNVVFTKANKSDGTAAINTNDQNIDFETKLLSTVNETAVLDYEVTNKSRQYNANVTITCGLKDTFTSFNEYFEITNDLASPFELASAESKTGKLTVKLKKAYTGSEMEVELACTLVASPVERESVGDIYKRKFRSNYVDSNLNGTDPVLVGDKLIPVKIAANGEVTIIDENEPWYDYQNKEWANAVILVDEPSKEYSVHDKIVENDIESYFVWIPRYRYQIFDKGEYTSRYITSSLPSESNAKEIQIVFEGKDTAASTGSEVGDWLTHPAFTNYDTAGIWVGKFDTGYLGATDVASAEVNAIDATKVIVKPNVYSWRDISVSNIFKTSLAYEENLNSHMMRNTEWGAVAYLSHSKYGINDEVRINNNSEYLTGYAANEKDASSSETNNSKYNTEIGHLASTTGNITGVYDMSGGAYKYVAGYISGNQGYAGFTADELTMYANHLDLYNASSNTETYNYRILGDATGEMGRFYSINSNIINNWYGDESYFINPSMSWFIRSGAYGFGSKAGQFFFYGSSGINARYHSFRITLAF